MKLQHWITVLAILAMAGFAMGCEEEAAEETETPTAETPPEETAEAVEEAVEEAEEAAEEMADEGGGAAEGVCGQAQACCEAYVEAMGANTPGLSVESTCAGIQNAGTGPAADTACQNMINGWRQSLEAMPNVETPSACSGS